MDDFYYKLRYLGQKFVLFVYDGKLPIPRNACISGTLSSQTRQDLESS